jgi:iron complex transport system substrate-binding protein
MNETNVASRSRRRFLAGGAAVAGTLLAGCSSNAEDGSDDGDTSYTVSIAPVGEVEFSETPESFAVYEAGYADMVVGLGGGDGLGSVGLPSRFHTDYYDQLDGVSVDKESLTPLWNDGVDKEVFYEIEADVHLIDPNWLVNNGAFGLDQADVDEVGEQVAPFFGNTIFRRTDEWHDYEYYSMYEAFEKVAAALQRTDRYDAFASFHDDFLAEVEADLPPAEERPDGMLVFAAGDEPEEFSPYRLSDEGTNKKQFRDLGIEDALAETGIEGLSTSERGTIDYETMLEVDPDSILVRGHEAKSESEFRDTVVSFMEDHDTASELTAVQEGRVFRGGPIYEGPVQNLFLTERFAQAYFPDVYGDGELFDRDELAGVINGEN